MPRLMLKCNMVQEVDSSYEYSADVRKSWMVNYSDFDINKTMESYELSIVKQDDYLSEDEFEVNKNFKIVFDKDDFEKLFLGIAKILEEVKESLFEESKKIPIKASISSSEDMPPYFPDKITWAEYVVFLRTKQSNPVLFINFFQESGAEFGPRFRKIFLTLYVKQILAKLEENQ